MIQYSGLSIGDEELRDSIYSESGGEFRPSDSGNFNPSVYGNVSPSNPSVYGNVDRHTYQTYSSFPSNYGSLQESEFEDSESAYGNSEQSNYGSFQRSDSENNEDLYGQCSSASYYGCPASLDLETKENPYGYSVSSSVSSPLFNQQFLQALQPESPNSSSTSCKQVPASKSTDRSPNSSHHSPGSSPKSRLKTALENRPTHVVIDSDDDNDIDDSGTFKARSKSHSLPDTNIFMVNGQRATNIFRKISECQVRPRGTLSTKKDRMFLQAQKDMEGKAWYDGIIDKETAGKLTFPYDKS